MKENSIETEHRPDDFNLAEEYHKELEILNSELEFHSNLTEFYDHATFITIILIVSFALIGERYYLSIGLTPLSIYFFLKFLKHRKSRKLSQYHIYILKVLFRKNYG